MKSSIKIRPNNAKGQKKNLNYIGIKYFKPQFNKNRELLSSKIMMYCIVFYIFSSI